MSIARITRRGIATLLVAACGHPTNVPVTRATKHETTIVTLPTIDAEAPRAVERPPPATYDVYLVAGETDSGWRAGVERIGAAVRIVLERVMMNGKPIELRGTIASDGSFDAKETRVAKGVTMKGAIDTSALRATLSDGVHENKIKLKRLTPFQAKGDETFTTTFSGTLGDPRLRVEWKQTSFKATVTWQLVAGPTHTLQGSVDKETGAFDLMETAQSGDVVSRWQGVLVSATTAIGRVSAGGKTESLTLDGASPTWLYAAPIPLIGGGRVLPNEEVMRGPAGCLTGVVLPTFEELPLANVQSSLNIALRHQLGAGFGFHVNECDLQVSYWQETAYRITAAGTGWIGIELRNYSYMGGAHGMYGSHCTVASTADGKLVDLASELTPASLVKLAPLVRAAILAERKIKSLTEVNFTSDDPKITSKRKMCVVDDHGPSLAVVYEGEWSDADAGMFRFDAVIAKVAAPAVRSLFPAGSIGALVFR